jgi:hypothetical protein
MGMPELADQHSDELAPTRQTITAIFGTGFLHKAFDLDARNNLEY